MRKGVVELAVLAIIGRQERYGYDIVEILKTNGLTITEGTVYPLLTRLRKEGFLDSRLVESELGPARKYYCLTASGREYLDALSIEWVDLSSGIYRVLNGDD
ncbi:MAG: PadR family transcriptional regulator [Candidatus Wallbacteria bacterium HGW-Wallbacteria-1]|jgi:PadR family transcriptional regulator PadR|uniref:PadR family transcriptional regulator n=1 Tax=Candidatus Wallbacteria bacterium HGW-Wallbacteria-1 TaxID=2013854 RepID=A0A2N1PM56_9BACT|nr:MAG: PadR family transcriptional regulator [Candidatus Wallbacteria bacterium HGW-Wallbacteria-1]